MENKRLFDLQQAQLKKEQDDLAAELAEFKKQKEELRLAQEKLAQEKEAEEQRKQIQEQARIQSIVDARKKELVSLGMAYNSYTHKFEFYNIVVNETDLLSVLPTDEWNAIINKITPAIT